MFFLLDKSLPQLLYYQFKRYWYFYLGAFLSLIGTHWTQSHIPFMAKELADLVSEGTEQIELWQFFLLAVGIIVFRTSSRLLFFHPARVLQKDLRVELLQRLEDCNPYRYKDHSDGQLFQVLQMDMEQIRAFIGFALLQVGNIIVAMSILIPKIANFNSHLLVALTPLLISFLLFSFVVSLNKTIYKEAQDKQGEVQNVIIECYSGKKTIKNFHSEKSFIDWFKLVSNEELWCFYKAGTRVAFSIPLLPLGIGFSLLWGAHIIYELNLGASSLILFSGFVFLFLEPIMFLSWIGVVFTRSFGSWQRIKKLITDISTETSYETHLVDKNNHSKDMFAVELWGQDLSLCIKENSLTVVTGKTGHGKTHILKQVADILMARKESISYVAQDPYLYSDSVINNIFLGYEYSREEKGKAYSLLKLFGLSYLAEDEESLFSMEIGEKGKRLSGGQAKRLALVRSIMGRANILLWDDPFSSVDVILERQILNELKDDKWIKDKTIVLTSHRLTTVRACDDFIHISKDNLIEEMGVVSEHLKQGNKLYEYFKQQMV